MKKYLAVLFITFSLAGCAGSLPSINNPVTVPTMDAVEDAYGAAIAIGVTYRRSCIARLIHKSCWLTIERLKPYENKAYKALIIARDFVKENPTLDATTVLNTAQQAIKAFADEQFLEGIK